MICLIIDYSLMFNVNTWIAKYIYISIQVWLCNFNEYVNNRNTYVLYDYSYIIYKEIDI
jgi:hypothetical protein